MDEHEYHNHEHMDHNRNRFPTLFEVLSRKTVAPLDLFSFYIYMRDQQRSVDYLDFWWVSVVKVYSVPILTAQQARCITASPAMSVVRPTSTPIGH
jgi:hypothetical protein